MAVVFLHEILPWSKSVGVTFDATGQEWGSNEDINQKVSLYQGDITKLRIDCIVNAAGIDKVIHSAAGKELSDACSRIVVGCPVGQCRLTEGFKLEAKYILHAVGPMDKDPTKLRNCYTSCLTAIIPNNIKSLAFCCIATGINFPRVQAAEIALSMTRMWLETNHSVVDRIIFCVLENEDFKLYNSLMAQRYFPNNIHFVLHNSPIVRKPKRSPKFDSEDDIFLVESSGNESQKKSSATGRKKKKRKVLPVRESTDKSMTFSDLLAQAQGDDDDESPITIYYDEIKSDVNKTDETCFYYKLAKNVYITYAIAHDCTKKSIRLDNLLERGLPRSGNTTSILRRDILDDFIQKCDKPVQITAVSTDLENQKSDLEGPWEYKSSSNVYIEYTVDNLSYNVRLDNLISRGCFTIPKQFRFYSFLLFKTYCKKIEVSFMRILVAVDYYYTVHPEYVTSQRLQEFCGPQSYDDRNCEERFFYYGCGTIKFYRKKDMSVL